MAFLFWRRFTLGRLFQRHPSDTADSPPQTRLEDIHATLTEEFRGIRKLLRKHGALLEEIQHPHIPATDSHGGKDSRLELMQLASAFFHLEQAMGERNALSAQRREAISLFWRQLDIVLARDSIEMIRERGVAFDPRLHRAVVAHPAVDGVKVVKDVLEPGFLENGQVRISAKVVLGGLDRPDEPDKYQTITTTEQEHP